MLKPGAEEDDWKAPYYIAITREGYRIQSQVLRIPDHLGLFDQVDDEPLRWAFETDIVMWLCVYMLFEATNSVKPQVNILGDVVIVWLLLFGGFWAFKASRRWLFSDVEDEENVPLLKDTGQ